ncbi:5762_t:CDS:2, partial [Gigaspora margarita]
MLIFGELVDVQTLWNENFNAMSEDFIKRGIPSGQSLINAVLFQIKDFLEQYSKNLNGTEPTIEEDMICIPDNMVIPWKDKTFLQLLIEYVYSDCPNYYTYFASQTILTTKNKHVDYVNNIILN